MSDKKPTNSARDVLKIVYSNICSLQKKTNDLDQDKQKIMEEVKVKFNSRLAVLDIDLSDESDDTSDSNDRD
ncbi:unnamed protein product [Rotaria magnacalcarata]|uniref:Uncharacterized protein n=1 Tax=Rotaria magnacalcarata TaxID=392030 RepID=A0A820BY98_9BILA|nr:unnamed protein product [Rotaria magnacalcarata]